MKFIIAISLLALSACALKPYSQEPLADGRTWIVNANQIDCREQESCKAEVKRVITTRGKLVCGAQPFRVISCDKKMTNYQAAKAKCMLRCGEAPASAQVSETADPDFQL